MGAGAWQVVGRRQGLIGGVEDELRTVFERKGYAHLLAGGDRNDCRDVLTESALQLIVTGEVATAQCFASGA
jgi:hypothetical protein